MSEQVTARVILRTADGSSLLDSEEALTAENVGKYRADEATVREASERLAAYGFEVLEKDPYGLSIRGDRALFEQVFQVSLEAHAAGGAGGSEARTYRAKDAITIPDDLASLVAAVVFPEPPELFP